MQDLYMVTVFCCCCFVFIFVFTYLQEMNDIFPFSTQNISLSWIMSRRPRPVWDPLLHLYHTVWPCSNVLETCLERDDGTRAVPHILKHWPNDDTSSQALWTFLSPAERDAGTQLASVLTTGLVAPNSSCLKCSFLNYSDRISIYFLYSGEKQVIPKSFG